MKANDQAQYLEKNVGNNKELGNNCYLDSELSKKE